MKNKMVKYLILLFLFVLTSAVLIGCRNKEKTENENKKEEITHVKKEHIEENEELADWGEWETVSAQTTTSAPRMVFVKFPDTAGVRCSTGKLAKQKDGTLVLFDGQVYNYSLNLTNPKEAFPAYFDQLTDILEDYRGENFSDFKYVIEEVEELEKNNFPMCKFLGTHSYKENGTEKTVSICIYAAIINNGATTYWAVLDDSTDQSLAKQVEKNADKMAETFCYGENY